MIAETESVSRTLAYHERTKHHLERYARSPGYLDWDTQPSSFRTFPDATRTTLPLRADGLTVPASALWRAGAAPAAALTLDALGIFLELALGLSAWKEYQGARWALGNNPSSGNLHPTEGYLVTAARPGLAAGVHHYVSRDHELERRGVPDDAAARELAGLLGAEAVLLGLSSVHWREAWKYGERAYRYCQHDAGHAIGAACFAAAALGWRARVLESPGDAEVAALLGLDVGADAVDGSAPDPEFPDLLLRVTATDAAALPPEPTAAELVRLSRGLTFVGRAAPPSTATVAWEVIDEVAAAAAKPRTTTVFHRRRRLLEKPAPTAGTTEPAAPGSSAEADLAAVTLIRRRRSAVSLDGVTGLGRLPFLELLSRLIPGPDSVPGDALPWEPCIHIALFLHRVEGLTPGLYLLERAAGCHAALREAMRPEFIWRPVEALPEECGLWLLEPGDFRPAARVICCHQEIAADGAFSLGMLAEFGATIRNRGAWWYRRLLHEAGVLGQALYLAAESAGLSATGIGCYFDDSLHELLGLREDRFQSLYHFTVGGAVLDPRLVTLPPYASHGA